ncbi:MAG: peptidase U32 family protein [Thermodesulfobacteriota bacterium]
MTDPAQNTLELLAPAGTIEAFEAAVAAGADAVYIGAPSFNARALARHFTLAEVAAMLDHAHRNGVKLYLAMNSLMKEEEIPRAVEVLDALSSLGADALIIQDLGIHHLARTYFPKLRLHASTLTGAHNSMNVHQFSAMGFARVVLPRELTIEEVSAIHQECPVELEVFVHGALCFAYSGLCLFSSYLGGKSGLRGRCVQPCRRRYAWGGKGREAGSAAGYLFSMNDLDSLELLPRLHEAGVTSLKIEGRMKSAQYVAAVVRAYRVALDAPGDAAALREARGLLDQAMGRRASSGYFLAAQPEGIIAPQHSGNIGLFLGKLEKSGPDGGQLRLREGLRLGDRLRLHQEGSGERLAFTLKSMRQGKAPVEAAKAGEAVWLAIPGGARSGDSLYKVDVEERRKVTAKAVQPNRFSAMAAKLVDPKRVGRIVRELIGVATPRLPAKPAGPQAGSARGPVAVPARGREPRRIPLPKREGGRRGQGAAAKWPFPWWLRIDDLELLKLRLPAPPARLVITLCRETMAQYARGRKWLTPFRGKVVWALPPVILEADLPFYTEAVERLRKAGFQAWQLGHVGQRLLFANAPTPDTADSPRPRGKAAKGASLELFGDYTLNVLNSLTLKALSGLGITASLASVETDRQNLAALLGNKSAIPVGMVLASRPPLFTARLNAPFFRYDRPLVSPKGELIVLKRRWEQTIAVADRPFSLLPQASDIASLGVAYGVIDLSNQSPRPEELAALFRQLDTPPRGPRLSTFNWLGSLP